MGQLQEKRSEKTADSSTRNSEEGAMRGEPMLELVRKLPSALGDYKFNDMTDYDIDYDPGVVHEALNDFNANNYDSKLKIETNVEK